jgi:tripartite-type tricarboxylate transporter receptor subunit TctC
VTTRRRVLLWLGAAALAAPLALFAQAPQDYPSKPVRVVVPFATGGLVDVTARVMSQKLTEQLGHPFLVENRVGAGGTIGAGMVAKASPDGYTLLVVENSLAVLPSLYRNLQFDVVGDLTGVVEVISAPMVLVVHPETRAQSFAELISLIKANPGKLNYGSGGRGSSPHLGIEMLRSQLGLDVVHVPYKGGAEALAALLSGQIQMQFVTPTLALPQVKSGKVRAVLVATQGKRSPVLPDVPTAREAGIPGFAVENWFGLLVPAGTPKAIVDKLNAEAVKALAAPDVRDRFVAQGLEIVGGTPDAFSQLVREEVKRWGAAVTAAGMQPE